MVLDKKFLQNFTRTDMLFLGRTHVYSKSKTRNLKPDSQNKQQKHLKTNDDKKNNPIGIFDSGIGGTSIMRELVKELPQEDMIYLADSINAPYGEKSKEEIIQLCKKNVDFLLSKSCKLIVVACNTATTNAIAELRNFYTIPFIGIEPAIKPAALGSKTKTIGILATKGTLNSELFHKTSNIYTKDVNVIEVIGKGLVEILENGDFGSSKLKNILTTYMQPMIDANIDYLVLGCSHYPYLIPLLKEIMPQNVQIIDSGEAVARQTKAVLGKFNLNNKKTSIGYRKFYTTAKEEVLNIIVSKFFHKYVLNPLKT